MEWDDDLDFETLEGWLIDVCLSGGIDPALKETEGFHAWFLASAQDRLLRQREQWLAGGQGKRPEERGGDWVSEKDRLVSMGRELLRSKSCWRTLSG